MTSSHHTSSGGPLPKGCVCGHNHQTHRGEHVEMCLECSCTERRRRCQNCGQDASYGVKSRPFDACSTRCFEQLKYHATLQETGR